MRTHTHRREGEISKAIALSEMRSKTSLKNSNTSTEIEKQKLKEEPHLEPRLSGALIRNLVRQLSSSRSKEAMKPISLNGKVGEGLDENLSKLSKGFTETQRQHHSPLRQPQTQPKKHVRRRHHTSRPYQERLINMAEARREIVAALKFHRATMKQASEKQQQHSASQLEFPSLLSRAPVYDSTTNTEHWKYPMTHQPNPTATATAYNYPNNTTFPSISHSPNFSLSYATISPVSFSENPDFTLPDQPLGLNLNLHDFNILESSFSNHSSTPFSLSSLTVTVPDSSSSSYCSSSTTMLASDVPSASIGPVMISETTSESTVESLHPLLDDKVMAEILSISEQHDMEWNDKLNLAHSDWWCKFLRNAETGPETQEEGILGKADEVGVFDEAIGVSSWLSDQPQQDDFSTDREYLHDAILPCLDVGEIEGIEGEWLL